MSGRILIVDDAKFMRTILKKILEKNGYQVVGEAANGKEGAEKYKELKPDLVTLDITMPDMTGLEALKAIMETDSSAKVIMCTALGQKPMVMEALQNGAMDYITKPFNAARIMDALGRCKV